MPFHTCCAFSRAFDLFEPFSQILHDLHPDLPVMNLYKICQILSYPIVTSITLFYYFFQIPRHKFSYAKMMLLDNQCVHTHFFLYRIRLAFSSWSSRLSIEIEAKYMIYTVSYGKLLVPVGYFVLDTIVEDFKRKSVFDQMFVQQGKVFCVVCYL